ncbi:hypothetical protein HY251_06810 [bacterium]|nr:hypothetical protein [bacterium]
MLAKILALGGSAAVLAIVAAIGSHGSHEKSSAERIAPLGPLSRLPENPFEAAREGDWASYVLRLSEGGAPPVSEAVVWKITKVSGDVATLCLETRATDGRLLPGTPREFLRSKAPTLEEYFRLPRVPMTIEGVTVGEGCFAFEKHAFNGRRYSFRCHGPDEQDGVAHVAALVSREIRGSGIASLSIGIVDKLHVTTIEYELKGVVNAEGKILGKSVVVMPVSPVPRRS